MLTAVSSQFVRLFFFFFKHQGNMLHFQFAPTSCLHRPTKCVIFSISRGKQDIAIYHRTSICSSQIQKSPLSTTIVSTAFPLLVSSLLDQLEKFLRRVDSGAFLHAQFLSSAFLPLQQADILGDTIADSLRCNILALIFRQVKSFLPKEAIRYLVRISAQHPSLSPASAKSLSCCTGKSVAEKQQKSRIYTWHHSDLIANTTFKLTTAVIAVIA